LEYSLGSVARRKWPLVLLALSMLPLLGLCAILVRFYVVFDGPGLYGPDEVTGFFALWSYPASLLLVIAAAIGFWRGRGAPRPGRPWLPGCLWAGVLASWISPFALLYYLPDRNLPSLVRHATGSDEDFYPCSKRDPFESGWMVSPQISARVAEHFPAGSSSSELASWLATQEFHAPKNLPCPGEESVHAMHYGEKSRRLTTVDATVYWRTDSAGKVVWTKATIWFTGL